MRKDFGAKPILYPMPVLIVAAYDENGTANIMNAAWGCISDMNQICLYLAADHKTTENILKTGEFTVSIADADHVVQADFVGVISGNNDPDKTAKSGFHTVRSNKVNAPLIEELPLTLECRLVSYEEEPERLLGEIVNVSAEESILDDKGNIDPLKLNPITYDPVNHKYITLGSIVGNAFHDGLQLK